MAVDKIFASGKRIGSRYGKRLRHKVAKIESEQRKRHKCPYCRSLAVKRQAAGIWGCKKCNTTFTGRAYTLPKKIIIKQELRKEEIVEHLEAPEEQKATKEEKPQRYKEKKAEEQQEVDYG